jgi:hypothetical protein
VRRAWTGDCDEVTLRHLDECLDNGSAPDLNYLAKATDRTVSAVRSRIRDRPGLSILYDRCKEQAKFTSPAAGVAGTAAAAGAAAGTGAGGAPGSRSRG